MKFLFGSVSVPQLTPSSFYLHTLDPSLPSLFHFLYDVCVCVHIGTYGIFTPVCILSLLSDTNMLHLWTNYICVQKSNYFLMCQFFDKLLIVCLIAIIRCNCSLFLMFSCFFVLLMLFLLILYYMSSWASHIHSSRSNSDGIFPLSRKSSFCIMNFNI